MAIVKAPPVSQPVTYQEVVQTQVSTPQVDPQEAYNQQVRKYNFAIDLAMRLAERQAKKNPGYYSSSDMRRIELAFKDAGLSKLAGREYYKSLIDNYSSRYEVEKPEAPTEAYNKWFEQKPVTITPPSGKVPTGTVPVESVKYTDVITGEQKAIYSGKITPPQFQTQPYLTTLPSGQIVYRDPTVIGKEYERPATKQEATSYLISIPDIVQADRTSLGKYSLTKEKFAQLNIDYQRILANIKAAKTQTIQSKPYGVVTKAAKQIYNEPIGIGIFGMPGSVITLKQIKEKVTSRFPKSKYALELFPETIGGAALTYGFLKGGSYLYSKAPILTQTAFTGLAAGSRFFAETPEEKSRANLGLALSLTPLAAKGLKFAFSKPAPVRVKAGEIIKVNGKSFKYNPNEDIAFLSKAKYVTINGKQYVAGQLELQQRIPAPYLRQAPSRFGTLIGKEPTFKLGAKGKLIVLNSKDTVLLNEAGEIVGVLSKGKFIKRPPLFVARKVGSKTLRPGFLTAGSREVSLKDFKTFPKELQQQILKSYSGDIGVLLANPKSKFYVSDVRGYALGRFTIGGKSKPVKLGRGLTRTEIFDEASFFSSDPATGISRYKIDSSFRDITMPRGDVYLKGIDKPPRLSKLTKAELNKALGVYYPKKNLIKVDLFGDDTFTLAHEAGHAKVYQALNKKMIRVDLKGKKFNDIYTELEKLGITKKKLDIGYPKEVVIDEAFADYFASKQLNKKTLINSKSTPKTYEYFKEIYNKQFIKERRLPMKVRYMTGYSDVSLNPPTDLTPQTTRPNLAKVKYYTGTPKENVENILVEGLKPKEVFTSQGGFGGKNVHLTTNIKFAERYTKGKGTVFEVKLTPEQKRSLKPIPGLRDAYDLRGSVPKEQLTPVKEAGKVLVQTEKPKPIPPKVLKTLQQSRGILATSLFPTTRAYAPAPKIRIDSQPVLGLALTPGLLFGQRTAQVSQTQQMQTQLLGTRTLNEFNQTLTTRTAQREIQQPRFIQRSAQTFRQLTNITTRTTTATRPGFPLIPRTPTTPLTPVPSISFRKKKRPTDIFGFSITPRRKPRRFARTPTITQQIFNLRGRAKPLSKLTGFETITL